MQVPTIKSPEHHIDNTDMSSAIWLIVQTDCLMEDYYQWHGNAGGHWQWIRDGCLSGGVACAYYAKVIEHISLSLHESYQSYLFETSPVCLLYNGDKRLISLNGL